MTSYILNTVLSFWHTLCAMAPYLLFGFAVAGVLSVMVSPDMVRRHLGGRGIWPVLKATLFGIPLPLCSCSVIPVTISLRKHGASKGSAVAFLIATPETGVDSIFVTFGLLGLVFAVFRPLAALVGGLFGGMLIDWFDPTDERTPPHVCEDACCTGTRASALVRMLHHAFVALPRDIAKSLIIGLALAGLITAVVPQDFFVGMLGTGIVPMLVMMAVGVPMYVCSTASVPIALALMEKGLSPGAALVFLIAGPATNAAGIAALWQLMGRRTALIYLAAIALTALGGGLVLDALFSLPSVKSVAHVHHGFELPAWASTTAAVGLIIMLAAPLVAPMLHRKHPCCAHKK